MKVRPSMKLARNVLGSILLPACVTLVGCGATPTSDETAGGAGRTGAGTGGHSAGSGGSGNTSNGGSGNSSFGGAGNTSNGGSGNSSFGGAGGTSSGGSGGTSFGGSGSGGRANGGAGGKANGGAGGKANGGAGGALGAAGSSAGSAGAPALDCAAPMPAGGTKHQSANQAGKAAGLDWTIWSNGTAGSITTYDTPAFSAAWNNSGDFLARVGLQWNATKTYDQLGTITAQFAATKTGTGGGYSYIGIYGWSVSPCIEWYIVDDSYNKMPVTPGGSKVGTAMIDGGTYNLIKRNTTGTGGSKCGSTTSWDQYYSIRTTARDCGQISITEHFKAWAANSLPLGKMDQAQILVEVGGGVGSIDFSVANVTATP